MFLKANDSYLHFRDYNCESITVYRKRLQAPGIQGKTGISTYNNTRIRVVTVYSHLGNLCHINRYWNVEEETWLESQNPPDYKHTTSVPKKWTAITASKIVNVIIDTIEPQLGMSTTLSYIVQNLLQKLHCSEESKFNSQDDSYVTVHLFWSDSAWRMGFLDPHIPLRGIQKKAIFRLYPISVLRGENSP